MKPNKLRRALTAALMLVLLSALLPAAVAAEGTVSFTARDDAGNVVSGATFALYDAANNKVTATSSSSGVVTFAGLASGAYFISIEAAPTGYALDTSLRANFTVLEDGGVVYSQEPATALILQRSRVEKVFPIRDVNGNAVTGAVFNVASYSGSFIENFTTTAEGLTLELPEGTYRITNVQTPASHEVSTAACTITVDNRGVYTYSENPTDVFKLSISKHSLTFTKKDDGGNGVSGAVFHIAGSGVNTTATSDSAGVVTFTGLLARGNYVLSERSAPAGYTKATSTVTITVDAEGKYTYDANPETVFVNARSKHQLTFSLRNDGGAAVSGAKFKLEGGGSSYEAVSELGTGRVLFKDVPFGTYTLTQTTPGEGYPAVSSKVIVTIYSDGGISFSSDPSEVFIAERTRYAFTFTAKEERGGTLEGATFKLESGKISLTEKSKTGGKVSFGDLLPGTYTLSQTATPAGYSPSVETVEVKVSEDGKVTYSKAPDATIIATIAKFSVSFDKMDDQGAPVAGAVFNLKGVDYERDGTSSSSGKVSFSGLLEGTYTLSEKSTPDGYALSSAKVTVTVSSVGLTTYSLDPAQAFTNARSQYTLEFLAVDDAGDPIRDAVFSLQGTGLNKEAPSTRRGMVVMNKLPHGAYILRQISAPDGYTRSPLTVQVKIEPGGKMLYEIVEGEGLPNTPIADLDGVFVSAAGPISFSFTSLSDDMEPLGGATFALVDVQSGATIVAMSNASGVAAFYGVQPGSYRMIQTGAPETFTPSGDEYAVTAESGGGIEIWFTAENEEDVLLFQEVLTEGETMLIPTVTFISDRQRRAITLRCEELGSGAPVSGAVFSLLTHPAGVNAGMLITGADGLATVGSLAQGSYQIVPESVPTGYELVLDGEPIIVRVTEQGDPETTVVKATPIAVQAAAQPEGLLATVLDFLTNNVAGLIASGTGALLLGIFLTLLFKR